MWSSHSATTLENKDRKTRCICNTTINTLATLLILRVEGNHWYSHRYELHSCTLLLLILWTLELPFCLSMASLHYSLVGLDSQDESILLSSAELDSRMETLRMESSLVSLAELDSQIEPPLPLQVRTIRISQLGPPWLHHSWVSSFIGPPLLGTGSSRQASIDRA
jgi:hypothetical protein